MTDLPPNWEWTTLGDIAEVRLGRQRSPKNHSGTYMRPYLRAANVGWDGLKLDDVKEMNFTDSEAEIYRLMPGDIVLSEASGSAGEVGKPAIWSGEIPDCCFQNTLVRVRSFGADPRYLLLLLRYEAMRGAFVEHSRGVGIHHIGAARLIAWPVPLPPLAEQHRIVASLDVLMSRMDSGIQYLDRTTSQLAQLRTARLQDLRRHALAVGADLAPLASVADTALGKMLDSKKSTGSPVPYLRNINVRWGEFDLSVIHTVPMTVEERERFSVQAGDLLVCEGGEPGRCAVWKSTSESMGFQKALHRVRPRAGVSSTWLALMLEDAVRSGRTEHMLTGTTIKHLPQEKLRTLRLPIPSTAVQLGLVRRFEEGTSAVDRLDESGRRVATRAVHLRRSLLAEAFAGRLVAQDPGDEPASVLLERIRVERETAGTRTRTGARTTAGSRAGSTGRQGRRAGSAGTRTSGREGSE